MIKQTATIFCLIFVLFFLLTPKVNASTNDYTDFLFISSNNIKSGDKIYIGSQNEISNFNFLINGNKLNKKCKTKNLCQLMIKGKEGTYLLTSNNPNIKPEEIVITKNTFKTPSITLKKIKLNKDTVIKGKNLTENIEVYTFLGTFTAQVKNNSFKINLPNISNITKKIKAPLYVKNSNGLMSDIMIVTYEI
jgi:hypothetical protein